MNLRILRTNFRWRIPAGHEVRYGGSNPVELVYDEKLQYFEDGEVIQDSGGLRRPGQWKDVPIVEEGEKPEHPQDRKDRLRREQQAEFFKREMPLAAKAFQKLGNEIKKGQT